MARRRKSESLAALLVTSPWWVSMLVACFAYVLLHWIIPSMFARSPVLQVLAMLSYSLAWLPTLVFVLIGVIAFVKSRSKRASAPRRAWHEPSAPKYPSAAKMGEPWRANAAANPVPFTPSIRSWTVEALRELEWKRFELLCAKYYEARGLRSETIQAGADGGIDVKLFAPGRSAPLAIVQCKAWKTYSVGVKEVRELLGVMVHEKIEGGIFITTGTYTKDALLFAVAKPIELIDGAAFVKKIQALSEDAQQSLFDYAFAGDYKTPTCASCGIKMVQRASKSGPLWGCLNYPRCKSTFAIKAAEQG
jgi:restriction system protein